MKKVLPLMVAAFITIGTTFPAAGVMAASNDNKSINQFNYSTIENMILDKNITLKTMDNTRDKLLKNQYILADAIDDLEDAMDKMDSTIDKMKSLPTYTNITPTSTDPEVITIIGDLNKTMGNLQALNAGSIASLRYSEESIENNLYTLKGQKNDISVARMKMIVQINSVEDQLVSTAKKLILGYDSLKLQKQKIEENLGTLQRNMVKIKMYKDIGMATDLDIDKIQSNIDSLNYAKNTIETQKVNIIRQLNVLIGDSYDSDAEIVSDTTLADTIELSVLNKEDDQNTAIDNNYNVKLIKYDETLANKEIDLADEYGSSDQEDAAEIDLENAELKYDDVVNAEELKYIKAYDDLMDKKDSLGVQVGFLEVEADNLNLAQKKYSAGLLCSKDMQDAESAYKIQQLNVEISKSNLYNSYVNYKYVLNGFTN